MMPLAMLRTLEGVLSVWKPTGGGGGLGQGHSLTLALGEGCGFER